MKIRVNNVTKAGCVETISAVLDTDHVVYYTCFITRVNSGGRIQSKGYINLYMIYNTEPLDEETPPFNFGVDYVLTAEYPDLDEYRRVLDVLCKLFKVKDV